MENQNNNPAQVAHAYVNSFENGLEFTPPSKGLITKEVFDRNALSVLKEHLTKTNATTRDNIVELLVHTSIQLALSNTEIEAIKDKEVLEVLAYEGLSKNDAGKERAMDALRKLVILEDLSRYQEQFNRTLRNEVSEGGLLLIAKAKVFSSKDLVDNLAFDDDWKDIEATKIAQAALSLEDSEITVDYIEKAKKQHEEGNIEEFISTIGTLSLIGTHSALKAVAQYLRTPLIIDKVGSYEKSVRLNVLEALLYHFPNEPKLYPNKIKSAEDYTAAEQFCIKQFGIEYTQPQPPFMTYIGYPTRIDD